MQVASNIPLQARLEARIQACNLLQHTFYQDWQAGRLTLNDLQLYTAQYYHFEANFPRFLSAIHSRCPEREVRQSILDNLWDEEHGQQNHRDLWLNFAAGLGLDPQDVEMSPPLATTHALVESYHQVCLKSSYQEGLAAVYAYEVQVPRVMGEKLVGLRERYGVTDAESLRFFEVHQTMDLEHSRQEVEAILAHTSTDHEAKVEDALQKALNAWWGFLDGVNAAR